MIVAARSSRNYVMLIDSLTNPTMLLNYPISQLLKGVDSCVVEDFDEVYDAVRMFSQNYDTIQLQYTPKGGGLKLWNATKGDFTDDKHGERPILVLSNSTQNVPKSIVTITSSTRRETISSTVHCRFLHPPDGSGRNPRAPFVDNPMRDSNSFYDACAVYPYPSQAGYDPTDYTWSGQSVKIAANKHDEMLTEIKTLWLEACKFNPHHMPADWYEYPDYHPHWE